MRAKHDVLWDVFLAAFSTGCLSAWLQVNPILIGLTVGVFGTLICTYNLKRYDKEKHEKDEENAE